ncbi:MAG: DMT family transporter [Phocaeicola sp.]
MINLRICVPYLALIVANVIWGLIAPINKSVLADIEVEQLILLRLGGAALLFWLTSLFLPTEKVERKDFPALFAASLLGITLCQSLYMYGLDMTSPIHAGLIVSLMPVITLLFSVFFYKESVSLGKKVGLFFSLIGVALLISNRGSAGGSTFLGDLICLLAQISLVSYLVFFRKWVKKYSIVTFNKWLFLFAFLTSLPFANPDWDLMQFADAARLRWMELSFLIVIGTFFVYFLTLLGLRKLSPFISAIFSYLSPVVTVVFSLYVGMDTLTVKMVMSILFIFIGLFLIIRYQKSSPPSDSTKR